MRLHSRTGNGVLVGFLVVVVVAAALSPGWAATGKSRELVVLDHERWLDTLKGTIKNYSKRPAREVTVVVKFFDRKKKALGTQRVNVGDLRSGDSSSWSLPIAEKNRSATQYTFETHAIW